jgi:transposase InsO family protein
VRYAFVARERTRYPIEVLCRVLEVSVSGFYEHRQRLAVPRPDPDAALRNDLRTVHRSSRNTYGRPRMVKALRACAHAVGPKRVARLMREEGLRGACKGGFKPSTTDSQHSRPVAANVLDRRFAVDADVPAWVSDITYLPTREGWLYLAVVISLMTRQVLGYSLADRMPDTLVQQAFHNAYAVSPAPPGTLFHSDRGSQYASKDFAQTLSPLGFVASMSRKGNCWDNAVAESFFATLKAEEATGTYETKAAAQAGIASYIHGFYNPTRLHSSLGYLSPNDYARRLEAA